MNVSGWTVAVIVLNMLIGVAIPVCLCVFLRRKFRCSLLSFFVGCGVMFLFALVLEQIVHMIVLALPVGNAIRDNLWLYALYGGLMAGLFEETGRFVAMKFVLKKQRGNDYNALMYGAGHGGFEAFYILFFAMLNNLIYSLMINSGSAEALLNGLDPVNQAAMREAFEALSTASPLLFLAAPVERLAAVTLQISLSVLVWNAVKGRGKIFWYPLAVALHFMVDAAAVLTNGYGVPVWGVEAIVWLITVLYVFLAVRVWKADKNRRRQAKETGDTANA